MILAVLGVTPRLIAQDADTATLTIRVVGAKNSKGQIAIALFNGETGFPANRSNTVRTLQVKIDPQTLSGQVTLNNLPRGVYAVSVFHDENMNGRLDKNVFGIPKEGYGASNNPKKSMGRQSSLMRSFSCIDRRKFLKSSCLLGPTVTD